MSVECTRSGHRAAVCAAKTLIDAAVAPTVRGGGPRPRGLRLGEWGAHGQVGKGEEGEDGSSSPSTGAVPSRAGLAQGRPFVRLGLRAWRWHECEAVTLEGHRPVPSAAIWKRRYFA
jgi:hypothetical protein